MEQTKKRDKFTGGFGFVLACIGSAVGMGNIWLFPRRVDKFGAPFLVAYLICVIIIGFTGVIGEMAFGRAFQKGPMGAFEEATGRTKLGKKTGGFLSLIPVLSSFALAIGYSVVVGWILKYTVGSVTGSVIKAKDFVAQFGMMATGHNILPWHIAALVITFAIVIFGISKGIEKANKVFMPLFFLMFIGIAIYVATLPGAVKGYMHMFGNFDVKTFVSGEMWKYALGQAFFSLSLAGSGTVVYGSYLSRDTNVKKCASMVALFDTLAAFVAALAIIPAVYAFGENTESAGMGGPGLLFVSLPQVFKGVPLGNVVMIIFFIAVLFAGLSSLINLFEAPIETLETKLGLNRKLAVAIVGVIGTIIAILIEGIVSGWMDICSIYLCPIGALLAGIMFFWLCGKKFVSDEISTGSLKNNGKFFAAAGRYVFCGLTVAVLVIGMLTPGGIG